jgi:putative Mg2+ transporter-C (MgtC) family protein
MDGLDVLARLGLAAVCGLAIGLERQLNQHEAGMRTHVLVALGAALFTIAGAYGFKDIDQAAAVDPARVAAQVASGVGFIGAGSIIRQGPSIRGLTSAATLWLTGALGVAAGAGAPLATLIVTVFVLLTLVGLGVARPFVDSWSLQSVTLEVDYAQGKGTLGPILEVLEQRKLKLEDLKIKDDPGNELRNVLMTVTGRKLSTLEDLAEQIQAMEGVQQVEIGHHYE